jgi:hypothetical protein
MRTKTIEEPDDAVTLLRAQQRDIDVLLRALAGARPGADLVAEAADLIAVHLALETRLLRPVVLALGEDVACLAGDEQAVCSSLLAEVLAEVLERGVEDPALRTLAGALRERLDAHAAEVERHVFKKLRARVPEIRLRRLAHEMRVLEFDLRVNARPPLGVLASSALAASA